MKKTVKKVESVDFSKLVLVEKPVRMSYQTYAYLKDLVEERRKLLQREYLNACRYIPPQPIADIRKRKKSGLDIANEIYREKDREFTIVLKELKAAAVASHKDNPNAALREFWGLKD